MNFIVIMLWPIFSPPATTVAAYAFATPFLVHFLRDWLIVSGVISPQSVLPIWFRRLSSNGLPLILRLAVLVVAVSPVLSRLLGSSAQVNIIVRLGLDSRKSSGNPLVLNWVVPVLLVLGLPGVPQPWLDSS
jgi:hypothetical protein